MKTLCITLVAIIGLSACGLFAKHDNTTPFTNYKKAKEYVQQNFKDSTETLLIADEMNDQMGIKMAIVLDAALQAGYMPEGFEQKDGYRVYRYHKQP